MQGGIGSWQEIHQKTWMIVRITSLPAQTGSSQVSLFEFQGFKEIRND